MIIYKRPVPFRNDYILRKRKLDKKQKKALDKVDEILDELEESIIDALIFMWALEAELVDISAVETVLQNPGDTYGIIAPFGDTLDDFVDDTLRPTMTHIGNEGYQETREQIDDLVISEPPAIEEVPATLPPIGDDEQTEEIPEENAFDYAAFYEQWCDEHTGELIVDITDMQRADVKSIISTAINEGMSPEMAARRIADTVGLTERQLKSNENYYNAIREQLAANNPNMSPAEIDRRAAAMAAKDADKKRRSRARSIARTEINIAHHKANEAYIKWAIEHGYMDAPDKEWVTSNKGNVCEMCLRLSQRAVPYDQEFVLDGFSVGLPPIHPQCCCAIIYVNHTEGRIYPTESEWDKMSEAERKAHINYFSDKAQYADYKKRLGKENVPKTLAEFQQMKYNNTERYKEIQGYYAYKGRYKSAELKHYQIHRDLKDLGIKNGVVLPAQNVNAYILKDENTNRDAYHIMHRMQERNITDDEVRSYKDNAKVMFSQWGGQRRAYYSEEGVSVITKNPEQWVFKTAWRKEDFDETTEKILEVINRYVK